MNINKSHTGLRSLSLVTSVAALAVLASGCVSGPRAAARPQKPPTAVEQKFFTVVTNYVPVYAVETNEVVSADPVTAAPVTNYVVQAVTNYAQEYVLTPNARAEAVAQTAGAVTSLAAPGLGALVVTVISGLFGIWGTLRSRRANATAASLAQIIETGEQVLLTLPNGPAIASQWKAWMVKHQAQAGVIGQASALVADIVDTEDARRAAAQIVELLNRTKA